jgi:TolB protein
MFATEEIQVSLETSKPLMPIYVSKVFNEKSNFQESYLEKLHSVLKFDMNYNGNTKVVANSTKDDFKVSHFDKEIAFEKSYWKKEKITFILKTEVNFSYINAYIYDVDKDNIKTFSHIDLTGNLNEDRVTIHKLSDNIHEFLFGQKGIAGLKILYTIKDKNTASSKSKWKSEIWMCDYDGENANQLSFDNNYLVHPIFIPKSISKEYIYVSYIEGQPKLFKNSLNKKEPMQFIKLRGNQLLPSVSYEGDKLAFICDASGRPDIFLQHLDKNGLTIGKPIQLFSFPNATNASPVFSNDGQKLAFVSDKDGTPRIYVIKIPDDLYLRKRPIAQMITKKNRENVSPSWSKDGKKLAYSAKTDKIRQIWIYDFDTDEEWQLTSGPMNKENPIFANDSLNIVYNTEDVSESELYLINIKQKEPIKITKNEGRKRFPSFEP